MRPAFLRTLALAPLAATMLSVPAPTPSPRLDDVLASPSDPAYVIDPTGVAFPEGYFTALQWAGTVGPDWENFNAALRKDGFLDGYERAWMDRKTGHELTAGVAAFAGGKGAEDFLNYARGRAPNPGYVGAITVSGLPMAVGAHYADPTSHHFSDEVAFFKGNDYFFISVGSPADNMDDIASQQATLQWDIAPAYTIPPAAWPENEPQPKRSTNLAEWIPAWVALAIFVGIIVGLRIYVLRSEEYPFLVAASRRRWGIGMPATRTRPASSEVKMSADGAKWWDGHTWKDAAVEAPPNAPLSADGSEWWDGQRWRPLPRSEGQVAR